MNNRIRTMRKSDSSKSSNATESPGATTNRERKPERAADAVDYRIRAESLRMAARHQVMDGGARIPYMTHAKLAGHVGCRREAVSRELKSLERDGIVIKQNRQFIVPDLERLRQRRDEAKR